MNNCEHRNKGYCGLCSHIGSENFSERYPVETKVFLGATAVCSLGIILNTFGIPEFSSSLVLATVSFAVSLIGVIR